MITSQLNFVDFGLSEILSEKYDSRNSVQNDAEVNRNQFFTSKHVLKGHPYTKRDDCIAIVYNLLFLMDPETSWFEKYMHLPYKETIKYKIEAS